MLVLLAGAVAAAHLVPGIDGSVIERNIRDSLHVIGFAGVAWVIFEFAPFGRLGKAMAAFAGAVMLGVLAEQAQRLAGYSFSEADIARDAGGAGLMIAARLLWTHAVSGMARIVLRALAVTAVVAAFAPLAFWSWGILSERLKAPIVMDFEGAYAKHYFGATNSEVALDSESTLDGGGENRFIKVMLTRAPRSGVLLATALYNWEGYQWLVFDARMVEGADAQVSVHINDYSSIGHFADTEAGMLTVTGAEQSYRVPIRDVISQAGRSDDAGNIRQLVIFSRSRNRGAIMRIDNVRLE